VAVKDTISANAAEAARWGLVKFREALRMSLVGSDKRLTKLAERRDFDIPGPAGPLPSRLYVPDSAGAKSPLLLFFHGGGFVTCDLDTHDAFCHRLAEAGQMRVVSCAYRLAPEAAWPAQLDDAVAAARWIHKHAASIGGLPEQLAIGGDSAGGYLAAATAGRLPKAFKVQMLVYPLLHLEDEVWADSLATNTRILGRLAVRYIDTQLGPPDVHAPSLLEEGRLAALSTVIAVGGVLDPCAPDAKPITEGLRARGASVVFREYPAPVHGFGNMTHRFAEARRAVAEIGELTGELLRA